MMAGGSLREYYWKQHLERRKRMTPPPKPKATLLLARPVAWKIIYNEPIGPVAPEGEPIYTLADYLGGLPPRTPLRPSLNRIQKVVAAYYKIGHNEMLSHRRTKNLIPPRFAYYHLAKTLTTHSTPEIGRRCGSRDHSTVDNGLKKLRANWAKHEADIEALTKLLTPK